MIYSVTQGFYRVGAASATSRKLTSSEEIRSLNHPIIA